MTRHTTNGPIYPGQISGRPTEGSPATGDIVLIVDVSSGLLKQATLTSLQTAVVGSGYIKADGTVPLTGNWDAGSFQIRAETFQSDVVTGTAPLTIASTTVVTNLNADMVDGANVNDGGSGSSDLWSAQKILSELQNSVDDRDWKNSVRAASVANVALATDVENADTLDGITLATGDRILLKNQTTVSENGIYVVAATGAPARADDLTTGDSAAGAAVPIEEGTSNDNTVWMCSSNAGSDVVGTNDLTWIKISDGGAGITSLNGETGGSQTFAKADDANVTLLIGSATNTHTFTLGWTGTLSHERGGLEADVSAYNGVPLVTGGTTSQLKYNLTATSAPTASDDNTAGYSIGSRWIDVTNDKEYVCLDASTGAAVWTETTQAGSGSGDPCCTTGDGTSWTARTAAEANVWQSVTYGDGLFVGVSSSGTNRAMTSSDAVTWTARSAAEANTWQSVTYGNGLFVAVSSDGTNRVMTSPDGATWTARSAAEANSWQSVTYGNGLFVAVSSDGTNRVMTSPDGITWTARSAAAANQWQSVTYRDGLFVAVSNSGTSRVMTSPDGITWTARTAAESNSWAAVTHGNGLFVAVSTSGTNRVMTSPDGITWTARSATEANNWFAVTYGNGLFVAVSTSGTNRVMTSPDGITWTARSAAEANAWIAVTCGNGVFVAISTGGTNRVMTSGKQQNRL